MKYRQLGNKDLNVSIICLGCMTFGEQSSEPNSFKLMDYARERGVNFFDTAEIYPIMPRKETYGRSEEIIGSWQKKRRNREQIILATKVASKNPAGIGFSELSWIRKGGKTLRFDRTNLTESVNSSLKRLQTDYIDLYQLHWPERREIVFGQTDFDRYTPDDDWTPIEEVLENLKQLVDSGKVRYVGLCNETPWGMLNYLRIAKEKKFPRMVSIQNNYSLVNRIFDISHSEVSIRENCGLLAYSPLAGGRLSGKYIEGTKTNNSRYNLWPKRVSGRNTTRGESAIIKYVKLAKKYHLTPSTLANAFVNSRPFVKSNIVGANSIKQLEENINSVGVVLTEDILSDIEAIHVSEPNPCP